jgi:hypothetical protein
MTDLDPFRHRVRLPAGATPVVAVGDTVEPGGPLAATVRPAGTLTVSLARPLRRKKPEVADLLAVTPGTHVRTDQPLARTSDREVRSPADGYFLAYDPARGNAELLAVAAGDPILSDVRGLVVGVESDAIVVAVPAVPVTAVAGSGPAVHGSFTVMAGQADAPLDPNLIDADAAGRVLVTGSWASAEAITRARAVGVAAIVAGGLHARDLADFAGLQHRRSLLGTAAPPFAVLALDGFGQAPMDPARFAWLLAHADREVTVLGDQRRLLVYDAAPAPSRDLRATSGDRVVIAAGPGRGQTGLLGEILDQPLAVGSGISAVCGLVRLDGGRTVPVPLANLETSPQLA